jgi:amino acid adenylation domain-containing protein
VNNELENNAIEDKISELSPKQKALLALRMKKQNNSNKQEDMKIIHIQREKEDKFITSYGQKRFWFLDSWNSNKAAYNNHFVSKIVGKLDFNALCSTFNEIIRRHEILQMVYSNLEDEVYCHHNIYSEFKIDTVEIKYSNKDIEKKRIKSFIDEEVHKAFDLSKDIPIRVTLLSASNNEYYLIIVIHHIVSDMWSLRTIKNEIQVLYRNFKEGKKIELEELPIQYMDYAEWQRNKLKSEIFTKQIEYWKSNLKGIPPCINLISDFPRPEIQTYNGGIYKFNIPEKLAKQVQSISSEYSITPFIFSLTAFAILLYRYTNTQDIVIGSPIAGRTSKETENLIGLFINTIALRMDLSNNPSIKTLIQRARKVVAGAIVNQEVPFEKIVEELNIQRDLSYSPVFQVMFNYQTIKKSVLELPELEVSPYSQSNNTIKFDLNLAVKYTEKEIVCNLAYNTDLFLPATIQRMGEQYLQVLSQMVNNIDFKIEDIPILSAKEEETIISNWNHSEYKSYPDIPYFHKLFEEQVLKTPNNIAVCCDGKKYTYDELNVRANQLGRYLKSLGIGPEKPVGVFLERSIDMIVSILGIIKAGGAYVPFDPIYPVERIKYIIEDASIDIIITEEALKDNLYDCGSINFISLEKDWIKIAGYDKENLETELEASNLFYIIYTSGSTGKPKGVAVEHRNYLNYYFGVMDRLKLQEGLKYAIASTIAADLATINIWAALNTGGQLHILTYNQSVDPIEFANYFRENSIDVIKMVPSHLKGLQQGTNLKDIIPNRCLILAGEASYWDMIEEIKRVKPETEIQIHYGPTETTVSMLTYTVAEKRLAQHTSMLPLGRPITNVSIYILDNNMKIVPLGVTGELYISGPGVSRGYWKNEGLTKEKFIPNIFDNDKGQVLYKTGDIVRYLEDGSIEFLGRIDEQVKIRGFRIELGEINSSLKEYSEVKDAFVMVKEDDLGEKRIVAYFVRNNADSDCNISDIRNHLKSKLPNYMIPSIFIELDKIPLNLNGKVNREMLPDPSNFEITSENIYEEPRNPLEERLVGIWKEVLSISKIGINDDFFSLGGDSFKAVQIVRSIDPTLSIIEIFKHPTIKELAGILAEDRVESNEVLYRLSKEKDVQEEFSVVCIPFAGGSAVSFHPLAQVFPDNYGIYGVQIPGHDLSKKDEKLEPLKDVARRCVEEIKEKCRSKTIVIYGHCLGGALAIEISRLLEEENLNLAGIFMGGNFPVSQLPGKFFELWNKLFPRDRRMSNRAYMELLRSLGGFTETLSKEEQDFIITSLRHDRRESERYYAERYSDENHKKLKAPLLCIIGELDRTTEFYEEQYKDWEYFCEEVDYKLIANAGHYFFKHQAEEVSDIMHKQLQQWEENESKLVSDDNTEIILKEKGIKTNDTSSSSEVIKPSLKIFFTFVLGQFISLLGSNLSSFAMGLWVYSKSGAVMDFAATLIFQRLPGIFVLPFAGTLADKRDRRYILIFSTSCSAIVTLVISFLFFKNTLQPWHIYLGVVIKSIASGFQRPAYLAAVAQITPKRYLGQANGMVQLSTSTGEIIAPLLAGFLVLKLNLAWITLIDFVTFLVCIGTLLAIRFPNTLFRRPEEPFFTQMAGGWKFIRKRKSFIAMIVYFVIINLMLGMANVLLTPLILTFESATVLGIATSANGLGGLFGGISMSMWGGKERRAEGMVGFGMLMGISYIIMGLKPSVNLIVIGVFLYGISLAMVNAHWQTLVQSKVRAELMGRVFSINQLFALPTIPLGYFIGALLSDKIFRPLFKLHPKLTSVFGWLVGTGEGRGIGLLFILIGLCMFVWSFAGMLYKPLRYMDDILPNAVPGALFIKDKDAIQLEEDKELERIERELQRVQSKSFKKNIFNRGA